MSARDAAEKGAASIERDTGFLVRAAQAGDRQAFGALYTRYASLVHGMLLAHVGSDDAADLVQDVFLHAMDRLDSINDPSAFGPWIAQVARNMSKMKSRTGLKLVSLDDDLAAEQHSPEAALDVERVMKALRSLPESYRETLALRLVEGMSGTDIAERTGLTPGSVRVNMHRGMEMLRARLGGVA